MLINYTDDKNKSWMMYDVYLPLTRTMNSDGSTWLRSNQLQKLHFNNKKKYFKKGSLQLWFKI